MPSVLAGFPLCVYAKLNIPMGPKPDWPWISPGDPQGGAPRPEHFAQGLAFF